MDIGCGYQAIQLQEIWEEISNRFDMKVIANFTVSLKLLYADEKIRGKI